MNLCFLWRLITKLNTKHAFNPYQSIAVIHLFTLTYHW